METVDAGLAKAALRKALRTTRREHVAGLDPRVKALMFLRPPSPLAALVPAGAVIGLYCAGPEEAPATAYARFFHEAGHPIAMPWFEDRGAPMQFRRWASPHLDELLTPGPYGAPQPLADAEPLVPGFLFVPLVGFTAQGARLGQGGGHYDRWLDAHSAVPAIGMAWDCQLADALPTEAHDRPLTAVVTPTRLYGPF
ncbi:MAG: 5-formyltetrahydrofolate cyclo-ligase [Novosphingobium sp.]